MSTEPDPAAETPDTRAGVPMSRDNPMSARRQLTSAQQCDARSKRTQQQCGQPAMRGFTKCRFHVGKSVADARAEADARAALLTVGALGKLGLLMRDAKADGDQIKAASKILDYSVKTRTDLLKAAIADREREVIGFFQIAVQKAGLTSEQIQIIAEELDRLDRDEPAADDDDDWTDGG